MLWRPTRGDEQGAGPAGGRERHFERRRQPHVLTDRDQLQEVYIATVTRVPRGSRSAASLETLAYQLSWMVDASPTA